MTAVVPSYGTTPNDVLLVGKAPGSDELESGRPFSGRAGEEQQRYFKHNGLSQFSFRLTNLVREYCPPDKNVTQEQIDYWWPHLEQEIRRCKPKIIIPIGAQPIKAFLGPHADVHAVHGIPHLAGTWHDDLSAAPYDTEKGTCILPVMQPAAGFYDPDARATVAWDFAQAARYIQAVRRGEPVDYRFDPYAGKEQYSDITGSALVRLLTLSAPAIIAIDTEGTPSDPWSLQICWEPGVSYLLRCSQPDFQVAIDHLKFMATIGVKIILHNAMYDMSMLRVMGLELYAADIHDTLMDAYFLRLEPLGLKPLSWRWLGVKMKSHEETVGALGIKFQLDYLRQVVEAAKGWPKPEPRVVIENDNRARVYTPNPLYNTVSKIIADVEAGKVDKEGEPADPRKRWKKIDRDLRKGAEKILGPMPVGSMRRLAEIDFPAAVEYSCRDADSTFRLYHKLRPVIISLRADPLTVTSNTNLSVFERMQWNGMPARRSKFVDLSAKMTEGMYRICAQLSHEYNDGKPINPGSQDQTNLLLARLGLKGTIVSKKTKKPSTGKKSIKYLKYHEDEHKRKAVTLLFDWREHQHTRDSFCTPTLDVVPEDVEECTVYYRLLPWGTHTRRQACKDQNLLAQPKHSIYGKMLRSCYIAPEGYVFIESDLSTIEVCVIADESKDPTLCRLLSTPGVDFHKETASRVWQIPLSEVSKDQRTVAKRIIFGTFYGQTGQGLKEQLWMEGLIQYDEIECQRLTDQIKREIYPGIQAYIDGVTEEVKRDKAGLVRDRWGMPRYLPGIHSTDRRVSEEASRHAVSHKIQGGAQGMLQNSISWLKWKLVDLWSQGVDLEPRLTIHDSLLFTCQERHVDVAREVLEEALTQHHGTRLRVPVRAESTVARVWAEV